MRVNKEPSFYLREGGVYCFARNVTLRDTSTNIIYMTEHGQKLFFMSIHAYGKIESNIVPVLKIRTIGTCNRIKPTTTTRNTNCAEFACISLYKYILGWVNTSLQRGRINMISLLKFGSKTKKTIKYFLTNVYLMINNCIKSYKLYNKLNKLSNTCNSILYFSNLLKSKCIQRSQNSDTSIINVKVLGENRSP